MIARITAFWALLGGVVLLAIMAITSVNVLAYVADRIAEIWGGNVFGTTGYEDFVTLAIASAGMMFLPYCQLRRGHIVVDVFANLLGPRVQALLDKTWLAVICALALFLAYWMTFGMLQVRGDNVLTAILGWPTWPSFLPGILSLLLWALVAGIQFLGISPDDI